MTKLFLVCVIDKLKSRLRTNKLCTEYNEINFIKKYELI